MFQTDTVYLQTVVETNIYGAISQVWTNATAVLCDVQDISKEYVYKEYGLTDANKFLRVFDLTQSAWKVGDQVSYLSEQYLIRNVISLNGKLGLSNNTEVILSKVI